MSENVYCKRFTLKQAENDEVYIILGKLLNDDGQFLTIKTANKRHIISKSLLLKIEETQQEFK